jgi:HD superfamily phosphohydrolase
MGMSYLVYPGAHHTRFHHALGAMHLMQQAVSLLRQKGFEIEEGEERGLYCAILLHDIGHGPFSHALENELIPGISHEQISLRFMQALNEEQGMLDESIAIFKGSHPKEFLNQLVSSQLDMDRLDYLKRDSFYTGVAEGNINSERLITMLTVQEGSLMVEEKGIYSVEKFLMARRFMYWQVYLHKTGLVAEQLLVRVVRRARELFQNGLLAEGSRQLRYFLERDPAAEFSRDDLIEFAKLDDVDILAALKEWTDSGDTVLSKLCDMLLNRQLLSIAIRKKPIPKEVLKKKLLKVCQRWSLSEAEARFFVFEGTLRNRAYDQEHQNIYMLQDNGKIRDVASSSDQLNLQALSEPVVKYYICYPKKGV